VSADYTADRPDFMSNSVPSRQPLLSRLFHAPAALLLMVGALLGVTFPLGKLSAAAGVPPLVWATLLSGGGALVLAIALLAKRPSLRPTRQLMRYFLIVAVVSYALPNAIIFAAIPHVGSAYAAIVFTLSPMFTVLFSFLAGLRSPQRLEFAGIFVGFVGTLLVASARGEVGRPVDWIWIGLVALVPVSLALGNVYRTIDLPRGVPNLVLAVGSNGVAALLLFVLCCANGQLGDFARLAAVPGLVVLQVAATAAMLALFFQLQVVGGPVTLSQIGTVAAAVGVIAGTLGLGERYPAVVWVGIAIIAVGLSLTVRARLRS
jgi:drug/metabolite transporter (DMT)-like permease